ncbi:acyl-CoA N-acyltransferase [Mycena amicta]|nr:acyl-CoA N-acyltransferase [Mycena amicta]
MPQKSPASHPHPRDKITIRQYLPQDRDQVFAMLDVGFALGPGSPGQIAVRKALATPAAFVSYAMFLLGLMLPFVAGAPLSGLPLCLSAIVIFLYLRRAPRQTMLQVCEEARQTDMRDIAEYYQITRGQALGPAGFWVAVIEAESRGGVDEIVGFFGMEHLPGQPKLGHLRRMIVAPKHRRRRIGSLIITAMIAHAQKHSPKGSPGGPLTTLELETSVYQPAARALYEKHGFRVIGSRFLPLAWPGFLHRVEMVRYRRAVWEKTDLEHKNRYGACEEV